MATHKVIWTIKELTDVMRERQLNKFDCDFGVSGKRGDGKCQAKGDKVLMSNGRFKNIEDVKIGEEVISPQKNGSCIISKVIGINSHYEKEVYNLIEQTRKKRILYTCSGKHKIPVIKRHSNRTSSDDSTPRIYYKSCDNITAEKISTFKERESHLVSFTTFKFQTKQIKEPLIEPYCLGAFLGDGCFSGGNISITTMDEEIAEHFKNYYKIIRCSDKKDTCAKSYHFSKLGDFALRLKIFNLDGKRSGDKFIPKEFIKYSNEDRLKLLAGLIDTDGFVSKNNQISVCSKSIELAKGIKQLVFSLGGYSLIRPIYKKCPGMKEKREYFDVSIQFKDPRIIPLKIPRKKERLRERKINPRSIAIVCEKTNSQTVYGIEIDSPSKWYVTNDYMITHNSTLLFKIFNSFKKEGFKPKKHQVYSQKDVMQLLSNQQFGFCWDDEAINSGYKRNFATAGQKVLIQLITNYRDNFNIYGSALPFFYSLDKDLRELMFMHIHIIERGVAVILLPLSDQIHSADPWDTKNNIKVEEKEYKLMKKNSKHKFRYHKLSTFVGYLYFGKMTKNQEEKYIELKREKRKRHFEGEGALGENGEESFIKRVYDSLIGEQLSREGLMQLCLIEGRKYSVVSATLNKMLTDNNVAETLKHFLTSSREKIKRELQREKRAKYLQKYNRKRWLKRKKELATQKKKEDKHAKEKETNSEKEKEIKQI